MPWTAPTRTLTLLVAPMVMAACSDPDGGGDTEGTAGTGAMTMMTMGADTTADDGADSTGTGSPPGPGPCDDMLGSIGLPADAYDLGLWVTQPNEFRHTLEGVVCSTDSDFFRFEPPCDGYLGVELRATNAGDQSDDLALVLSDSSETLVVSEGDPNNGAHRMELAHQPVSSQAYTIEVQQVAGGTVPYELTVFFLPSGQCQSADWTCEADVSLVATRTACDGEPLTGGICDPMDLDETAVALPVVGVGGEAFSGWLVNTAPDEVRYHGNPTTAELTAIADRCEEACVAEYAGNPFVAANCSAGFSTPELHNRPGVPARALIPSGMQDGSGLFAGQSLSCNLHDTCAAEFDELLGTAIPDRVTPAGHPLGLAQEWELSVLGAAHADSDAAASETTAAMVGTIGYSFCTEGDGVNCPFHLGSLHLETTEALEVELDCGAGTEVHEITDLEFDLVQPAFGISEIGTSYKGFPPLSLVIAASAEVDEEPIALMAPITMPIYYRAGYGWTVLQGADGAYIKTLVPCGTGLAEVSLWWSFNEDETLQSPPSVSLSLPDTVACPDELELTLATGVDPDDDLASLEWIVDGILMSETWPTIDFTRDHEITAVLRDARGATASATKTVTCQ